MSIAQPRMADIDLNDADRAIIAELRGGRNLAANIAESTDYSRQYISDRLRRLSEHGVVVNVGRGLYELVPEEVPEDGGD